ncbi:MAG TPA: hypothetical protein VGC84_00425 [Ilumatobacteraceae bacterium]|jgi:hypothetical protein
MNTPTSSDTVAGSPAGTNRRVFLIAGASVLAGSVLLRRDLGTTNGGLAAFVAAGGPQISVGYVDGSAGATSLADALASGDRRAVNASSLRVGDLRNHVAELAVHGFTPGVTSDVCCPYDNVLVDAHIPSPDAFGKDATIPFYAWTFRRLPAAMASGRSRFVIAPSRGLRVGFSVDAGNGPSSIVFTNANERSLPTLQRGVYLLGLQPDAWREPRSLPTIDDATAWAKLASIVVVANGV